MRQFAARNAISAAIVLAACASSLHAVSLLSVGDYCVAIDLDSPGSLSGYPAAESPAKLLDGLANTKYLNFAKSNSGFIITPAAGASIVQSMKLTTANDHPERDPDTYALYGTNDAIVSTDNSAGIAENWTPISTGTLGLPDTRGTAVTVTNIANATAYTSYKLVFPTLKNVISADSMQVADVQFYPTPDATGTGIFASTDPTKAVDADVIYGNHATGEGAFNAIDTTTAVYRNTGKVNSGFIVAPWVGSTIVTGFTVSTGATNVEQDPTSFALYGTNNPILDGDNSNAGGETWTLIASGALDLPQTRSTPGTPVAFTNTTPYTSYLLVFTGLRDASTATACLIGEVQFDGTILATLPLPLLAPSDAIIAIDTDGTGTSSNYPAAEDPPKIFDGLTTTKYLNFGKDDSGFIMTPSYGLSTIHSMVLTTAGDAEERDPSSYSLWGTNDPILSTNNSLGNSESWTLISAGALSLPSSRQTPGPVVTFGNSTAYASYRLIFTDVKTPSLANSMQIAEVGFYESTDGTGTSVLAAGGTILAIDLDPGTTGSSSPAGEGVTNAINGTLAKYLNSGNVNSGFIVTPALSPTNVSAIRFITANDFPARDPAAFSLYGTNDAIRSTANSVGRKENWTLITSGSLNLPLARYTSSGLIPITNQNIYKSYKMVFTALRDAPNAGSVQFAEIQFYGQVGAPCPVPFADADGDQDVDMADFGVIQSCITGAGGTYGVNCRCFDTGAKDNDIDVEDLGRFLDCYTGPTILWSMQVTPNCVPQ